MATSGDTLTNDLDCYLVGGAVRDELLGRPGGDRDWVVVGADVEQMLAKGFVQIGRDFPVFLHPHSKEEYALARIERKRGAGHTGFTVIASPEVTLEEDLLRRDLTINAMARDRQGVLVDPFDGQADLAGRTFRQVSAAFAEDPLRVFRVARFAAQMPEFTVAEQTQKTMQQMALSGELRSLSAERVWQEFRKALEAAEPTRFFTVLADCSGLEDWFAECVQLSPTSLSEVLRAATPGEQELASVKFAALPLQEQQFRQLGQRLRAPKATLQLAEDRCRYIAGLERWSELDGQRLYHLLDALQALHTPTRLLSLLPWLTASGQERLKTLLLPMLPRLKAVPPRPENGSTPTGKAYGNALALARSEWLDKWLTQTDSP